MNVTIYRHEKYNKFQVTIENGFNVNTFTVYDMSVQELGEFIKGLTGENEND